jgi:predicted DNA-binding transcriptional regulator YafY
MTFVQKHQCLERLKEWLRKGRRGSLKELADAFEVSTRTMKRWIAEIRKYEGWDIEYCRVANRYEVRGMEKDEKI